MQKQDELDPKKLEDGNSDSAGSNTNIPNSDTSDPGVPEEGRNLSEADDEDTGGSNPPPNKPREN